MAFGLFHRAEIRHDLAGLHHHFAQQQGAGTHDFAHHAHHAHQGVHLQQVAAGGAQGFPNVGHRVQADDVDTVVAQVQHVVRHVVEHGGVGVVQIPLVGIEGGHDHFFCFLAPGKVARRGGGEDLGHGLLIPVGNIPGVIEEIAVLALDVARPGFLRPFVILAGVVHHEVQAHGDAPLMALFGKAVQILHRTQLGLHLPEIAHGVAAVAAALGAFQQRHQMEVIHAAVGDIIQLFLHALEGSREGVYIH